MNRAALLTPVIAGLGLVACGPPQPESRQLEIRFAARAGDTEVGCGKTVTGLGTTGTSFTVEDLRFYVHDFRAVDAEGNEVQLPLVADGSWQSDQVALLDFEDKSVGCTNGTTQTRDRVVVTAPMGSLNGVRFRMGVPESLNHEDASVAKSPLNLSTMFWSWKAGYKHLRLEGKSTGLPTGYDLHVGSNGCDGDPVVCSEPGQVDVRLDSFEPSNGVVVFDLEELFATANLDANAASTPPGCMGSPASDADCVPVFERLGLTGSGGQKAFRAEAAP